MWTNIHSDMSKLLLPVLASRPESPWKLVFFGRLALSRPANSELVTQGGFPITSIGSGRSVRSFPQSTSKKVSRKTTALSAYGRVLNLFLARSTCLELMSTPTALTTDGNRSRADNSRFPSPQVGSTMELGLTPSANKNSQISLARSVGVWKSPNSILWVEFLAFILLIGFAGYRPRCQRSRLPDDIEASIEVRWRWSSIPSRGDSGESLEQAFELECHPQASVCLP